jgi:geranylgeranyl transferase type-2 subunit beta
LEKLDMIDLEIAIEFVLSCRNFDGGFGGEPLMESHAAYVFCCVGALAVCGALDRFDLDVGSKQGFIFYIKRLWECG